MNSGFYLAGQPDCALIGQQRPSENGGIHVLGTEGSEPRCRSAVLMALWLGETTPGRVEWRNRTRQSHRWASSHCRDFRTEQKKSGPATGTEPVCKLTTY
jgi:hypothetical protein